MSQRLETSSVKTRVQFIQRLGLAVASLGMLAFASSSLLAQAPTSPGAPAVEPGPRYHHASTIDQGYLDGWASVIRSRGQAQYNLSLAARNYQAAYEHALDNAVRKVDAYYARKEVRREYLDKYRRPPLTVERILQHNEMRKPNRMSALQLSETTGRLTWPAVLSDEQYAPCRERLNQLFAERSTVESGRGSKNLREIKRAVDHLYELVRQDTRSGVMDAQEFCAANRFLKSLRSEAHYAPSNLSIASR